MVELVPEPRNGIEMQSSHHKNYISKSQGVLHCEEIVLRLCGGGLEKEPCLPNVPWVGTNKFIIGRRTVSEEKHFIPPVSLFFVCLIQPFPLKSNPFHSVSMWMANRYRALLYFHEGNGRGCL